MVSGRTLFWMGAGQILFSIRAGAIPPELSTPVARRGQQAPPSSLQRKWEDTWQQRVGASTVALLAHPTRIEAFRVRWDNRTGEQIVANSRISLPQALGQHVSQILRNKRAHMGMESIKCHHSLVLYRFWQGTQSVDVRVYFHCLGLCIIDSQGHTVEQSGFRSVYPEMVRLAKAAFPKAPDIQALKETASVDRERNAA